VERPLGVRSFYKRTRAPEQRRGRNIRKIKEEPMYCRGRNFENWRNIVKWK
jgi:hypothetical protein